jgi:hypothetical protein
MSEIIKQGEPITTPTEQEQEAITGGISTPGYSQGPSREIDPEKLHRTVRPKWDPGGPPQGLP